MSLDIENASGRMLNEMIEAVAEVFAEILERRDLAPADVGGVEPLAIAYVGAGESLANWWLDHPDESPEAMATRLMNVGWVGLEGLLQGRAEPWRWEARVLGSPK